MFSISQTLSESFKLTFKRLPTLFLASVFSNIPAILLIIFNSGRQNVNLFVFLFYVLQSYLYFGFINFVLHYVKYNHINWSCFFISGEKFFKLLVAYILYSLILIVGLTLLIIPGIIWSMKFIFNSILILDKNTGIKEAFYKSKQITRGALWKLLWLNIILCLIELAGIIALVLGIFVAQAVVTVALVKVYLTLAENYELASA